MAFSREIMPKLQRLLLLLTSDRDGEALAARNAISRMLKANGADWHDLTAALGAPAARREQEPPKRRTPSWQNMVGTCTAYDEFLNAREKKFVWDLVQWRTRPSDKQIKWLTSIYEHASKMTAG